MLNKSQTYLHVYEDIKYIIVTNLLKFLKIYDKYFTYKFLNFSISFLNLNAKSFPSIRAEFAKFGEIVGMTNGGGGNTDELVCISYADKQAAVRALKTHFTNKDYPYLDIAKGRIFFTFFKATN